MRIMLFFSVVIATKLSEDDFPNCHFEVAYSTRPLRAPFHGHHD